MTDILAFTALRPRELTDPLEATGYTGTVINIDNDRTLPGRIFQQIIQGVRNPDFKPDVVMVYNGTGVLGIISLLFGWYYSAAVIVRVNGNVFRQHREKTDEFLTGGQYGAFLLYSLLGLATRVTYALADGYLVVSEELRHAIQTNTNCSESRIAVVHNPVPDVSPPEDGQTPIGPAQHDRILLTVTNLNYEGKFEGVKQIIDSVGRDLPDDVGYVIAGGGIYLEELRAYLDQAAPEASDQIHILGYVNDIELLYDAADVFVYVSYIDGFPNVVLEAQAAGLPVIANAAYGMVEQIEDGESGVLVEGSDGSTLADAVHRLLDDPELRERLGTAAREQVTEKNSPERIGTELLEATVNVSTTNEIDTS
ncbi:Glycosyltransferase involved in cell wall bisynthesis [Haloarcula vallismortis]|uniref:Group 1 glycosyl transferase n=2 Tax=Haloarcula vallismortis TaxID=28442 RepID=M0J6Q7_HALVA|nr:glycosyltransferase family 4 protein [Haloarcula vallismortis]EMA04651.1 group 1 glycosyl transferase [Haloarcula vallismortis ATCC 29715]SDX15196.1 Glycosyltransferase involved in cell wall bisynthesis [Haloarcula vallismortis]